MVGYFIFDEVLAWTYVLCSLKTNDTYGKEHINHVDSINYLHMGGQATNTDNSKQWFHIQISTIWWFNHKNKHWCDAIY